MDAYFSGTFEHQLDDKNRLRIPAKFRKTLVGERGEKSYSFARGMNGCIYVFPEEVLQETLAELSKEKMGEASLASLLFFSSVYTAEEDAQGRVVLPSKLKAIAGITKDIVTVGRGKRLEIWSAERFEELTSPSNFEEEFRKLGI
ncbi:MAG: transcriptional regulator MraZ [Clostridia bacterium]|nr:transcriptional regulator MraZ [Clostridia bacterium]